MEIETIKGIINIDLDSVSLNDVSNIISQISVDAGVDDSAKTILYSGSINGYKTGDIANSLDNVRIIDNTSVGKFLADNSDTSKFNELLESAIRNEITNGSFDISSIEKGLRSKDYQRLLDLLEDIDSLTPETLSEAIKIASNGYKYEPTKGAWAIASEQFIKATPAGSEIICLTAEADLTRTWAQVEIPTALKYLPNDQLFGGYTIAELKSVYNLSGLESVQNLLKVKSVDITQNIKVHYGINGEILGMDASYLVDGTSYVKPSESVFEVTVGEVRNFTPESEILEVYPEYKNLTRIEQLQLRYIDGEYKSFFDLLDSTTIEPISDIRKKYLSAVGKTEDTLGVFDKQTLKLLEGTLSGNKTVTDAVLKFSSAMTKVGKSVKVALPYVDLLFTTIDFLFAIEKIQEAYSQGIDVAKKVARNELTRFAMEATLAYASAELMSVILGIGMSMGPVGTFAALVIDGGIMLADYFIITEVLSDDDFINDFWNRLGGNQLSEIVSRTKAPLLSGYNEIIEDKNGLNHWQDNDSSNVIYGYDGDDKIYAGGGNDLVYGGTGFDSLYGDEGNDIIFGENGENIESDETDDNNLSSADIINGGNGDDYIYGEEGIDILIGGNGFDYLYGGSASDTMYGDEVSSELLPGLLVPSKSDNSSSSSVLELGATPGADYMYGGQGNDTMFGGDGSDTMFGGTGDDTMHGEDDPTSDEMNNFMVEAGMMIGDYLSGDEGNDTILGGDGNDYIFGGDDEDELNGDAGDDYIEGGLNNDIIKGGTGDDWIYGGTKNQTSDDYSSDVTQSSGNDEIYGEDGNDVIYGGDGNDVIDGGTDLTSEDASIPSSADQIAIGDRIFGEYGDDSIHGNTGNDYVDGGSGNDFLYGDEGNDIMLGQDGNDTIEGGNGVNFIWGGNGTDTITGGDNTDYIYGGFDNDTINGGNGENYLFGQEGIDYIYGGDDADYIDGGIENDHLYGGNGINEIYGREGSDIIYDGDHSSYIEGNEGDDTIRAGGGDDIIDGGSGNDYIQDDHGDDIIIFKSGYGVDTISDAGGYNTLMLSDINISNATFSKSGNDLIISFGLDTVILKQYYDFYNFNINGVDVSEVIAALYGTNNDDWMNSANNNDGSLYGGNGNDNLNGGSGKDQLYGETGNDNLYGNDGDDTLDGAEGNDYLSGGNGNDTYIFGKSYGNDSIDDWGGSSTVNFKDINADEITVSHQDANLVVSVNGTSDSLVINGYQWNQGGYTFEFADGTTGTVNKETWELELGSSTSSGGDTSDESGSENTGDSGTGDSGTGDTTTDSPNTGDSTGEGETTQPDVDVTDGYIVNGSANDEWLSATNDNGGVIDAGDGDDGLNGGNGSDKLYGGAGTDNLYGNDGDDILDGGTGTDGLNGGNGTDTYIFAKGYGNDTVNEWGSDITVIKLNDINSDEVTLNSQSENNLVISVNGTSDTLTISNYRWSQGSFTLEFADDAVAAVNKETWEMEYSQNPTDVTESVVSEEELVQSNAGLLAEMYADDTVATELITETDNTIISDVTESTTVADETNEVAVQTDLQVMILTENMSAFADEDNVSDGINVADASTDVTVMSQLLVNSAV